MVKIGIIGGSGLDNPNILEDAKDLDVMTPYGAPSSSLKLGKIKGIDVVLIARHGREHTIPPTQVNFRANIHALKEQGCTHILATTAVGSLRENISRGHLVILDQFIDFTRHRSITFHDKFEEHKPAHCAMAEPFDRELRDLLVESAKELSLEHHEKGTVITIEGPRFSTKAESKVFILWGADVINMSVAPECILANEAGIPYAAVAMSTDYDSWKEDEEPVSWEEILKVFKQNIEKVTKLLTTAIPKIAQDNISLIKSKIKTYPHWPKQGVMFRDINSLLNEKDGLKLLMNELVKRYKDMDFDVVAGVESRGFIMGSILAEKLGKSFVLIRKPGKLPGDVDKLEYQTEYSTDSIEVQKSAIKPGSKVLITDDLIATGGTLLAAAELVKKLGAEVVECSAVIDLPDLGGSKKLEQAGFSVYHLLSFEGE
ncbi:S-methyl-5'-thioadenosine phosphorylase [Candidatus Woesearchaeota archaeon]|nr:S-methyl-5'-thioadenosine phosphorylase [Candidatus Woesearchaeota archaeon]MBW3021886.1 S-methyl-5'-thioadenosine phosphorylase [Candidatus Woesearchaeota archaeon]